MRGARRQAGFTLLEILVALVVLGFLLAGLSQGLHFGLAAWERQTRGIDRHGDLDAVDRTLRRLIAGADPGDATEESGFAGTASSLVLIGGLPDAAGLTTRPSDIRLLLDARHQLILRWAPHHEGQPIGPPPRPVDTVLLRDVQRLELAYWPPPPATGWRRAWNGQGLPALVRIRIVFTPGDGRRWPDIVAAPMRARP